MVTKGFRPGIGPAPSCAGHVTSVSFSGLFLTLKAEGQQCLAESLNRIHQALTLCSSPCWTQGEPNKRLEAPPSCRSLPLKLDNIEGPGSSLRVLGIHQKIQAGVWQGQTCILERTLVRNSEEREVVEIPEY